MTDQRLPVYERPEERTSPMFAKAFALGSGGIVRHRYQLGPWAGFGSPQNFHELRATIRAGFDFFYGDHAYFSRGNFYRVTKDALFHYGTGKSDMQRIKKFYPGRLKPWTRGGKYVVICPQSDPFFKRNGTTQAAWIKETQETLREYTDRKIVMHYKSDTKPLAELLQHAYCVVSYSSNSALEAILSGVPAINTGDSHAALMCSGRLAEIENLYRPDNRLEWAAVLADNQWTLDEISSGICWRKLNDEI